MSSRFDDGDDEEKPPKNTYYYIKAKYTASYEAVLPISMVDGIQEVNSEKCIEFVCLPMVEGEDQTPDYGSESTQRPIRCIEPKCPKGYIMKLELMKTANECPK